MSIDDPAELEGLQRAGAVVAATLRELRPQVRPGVTAELDGFYADACVTVPVGEVEPRRRRLITAAEVGLRRGLAAARDGAALNAIGAAVERAVTGRGFSVCHELTGHGIGRRIHEPPTVANVYDAGASEPLTAGLVITVEPIIAAGRGDVVGLPDGWTVVTRDGSPVAHAEHTIVVTEGDAIVLTG